MAGNALLQRTPGKVVVLGDIFVDVVLRVPYYPEEGLDAMAREIDIRQGGSSTATSIVLSRLGIESRVLGRVGDDPLGDIALELLQESGSQQSAYNGTLTTVPTFCLQSYQTMAKEPCSLTGGQRLPYRISSH